MRKEDTSGDYPTIETFRDVVDYIFYDLDNNYSLRRDSQGDFYVNKLCISPDYLTYKMQIYKMAPGLYEKLVVFYSLMQETTDEV